jgi:hypothetical protein
MRIHRNEHVPRLPAFAAKGSVVTERTSHFAR